MSTGDSFNDWLVAKMKLMNLDEDVYVSYIKGILDSEDSINEKISSIHDIISEISLPSASKGSFFIDVPRNLEQPHSSDLSTEDSKDSNNELPQENCNKLNADISLDETCNITELCEEMCARYIAAQSVDLSKEKKDDETTIEMKLAFIMEKQAQSIPKMIKTTKSEKGLKDAILAQYAEVSDDENDPNLFDECSNVPANSVGSSIPQNTNVNAVISAEKDLREKAKAEYENKKAQDKLNKEKQKQKQQERREKERKRTQKQEHRR